MIDCDFCNKNNEFGGMFVSDLGFTWNACEKCVAWIGILQRLLSGQNPPIDVDDAVDSYEDRLTGLDEGDDLYEEFEDMSLQEFVATVMRPDDD